MLQSHVPGPGTYGKGGIPSAVIEEKVQKSVSNVGMLDSGKSYKRQLPEVVCTLPINATLLGEYHQKSLNNIHL